MCLALAYGMKKQSDKKKAGPNVRSVDASYRPASPTSKLPGAPAPAASYSPPQSGGYTQGS